MACKRRIASTARCLARTRWKHERLKEFSFWVAQQFSSAGALARGGRLRLGETPLSASEISCSRQTSRTLRSPRKPASTISAFCPGDHDRLSCFSLTRPTPRSHEQPSPQAHQPRQPTTHHPGPGQVPWVPLPVAGNPMGKGIFRPSGRIFVWVPLGRGLGPRAHRHGGGRRGTCFVGTDRARPKTNRAAARPIGRPVADHGRSCSVMVWGPMGVGSSTANARARRFVRDPRPSRRPPSRQWPERERNKRYGHRAQLRAPSAQADPDRDRQRPEQDRRDAGEEDIHAAQCCGRLLSIAARHRERHQAGPA